MVKAYTSLDSVARKIQQLIVSFACRQGRPKFAVGLICEWSWTVECMQRKMSALFSIVTFRRRSDWRLRQMDVVCRICWTTTTPFIFYCGYWSDYMNEKAVNVSLLATNELYECVRVCVCVDRFSRFCTAHTCVEQTDRQTDTPHSVPYL